MAVGFQGKDVAAKHGSFPFFVDKKRIAGISAACKPDGAGKGSASRPAGTKAMPPINIFAVRGPVSKNGTDGMRETVCRPCRGEKSSRGASRCCMVQKSFPHELLPLFPGGGSAS